MYQVIGELFVARARTDAMYQEMLVQADEMAKTITELREINGQLSLEIMHIRNTNG